MKRLRYVLLLPLGVLVIGTAGFMLLEGLSFVDALYFTVVTITTVGFGDILPTSVGSKVFAIFIIIIGISTFLTILTNLAQWLIRRGQMKMHRHRLNMLIGVFFTEAGNELLRRFTRFDPNIERVRQDFLVTAQWTGAEFQHLKKHLGGYHYAIDARLLELEPLRAFLCEKGDMLVRLLENPDLVESETFSELLWAIVHLRDELVARRDFADLPPSDLEHLVVDVHRAYGHLARQWLDYLQFLQNRYPFLFSLALRTNPFLENASPVIEK